MKKLMLMATLSVMLLSGCILGDKKIALDYGPNYQPANSSGASGPIVLEDFSDKRPEKRVGERKNIYFMTMSKVYAENDVVKWVTDAVENELKINGYSVQRSSGPAAQSKTPVLSGDIFDLNSISYMTYTGIISLKASLTTSSNDKFVTMITTETKTGLNMAASSKGHGEALTGALGIAVEKLVQFVKEKLKQ